MRLNLKDIILLGLLNFVLFVGAGNLIFPPFIGFMAGPYIWIAVAGFLLTGVGLPVLTSVVVGYVGGNVSRLALPLGATASSVFLAIIYLCAGPLGGLPRAATVAYSLTLAPFGASVYAQLVYYLCFYGLVVAASLYPHKLFQILGQFLTPIKLIALLLLCISVFSAVCHGTPKALGAYAHLPFFEGIKQGYLTLDTFGALFFGIVMCNAIRSRGVVQPSRIAFYAFTSASIAAIGLIFTYICLFQLGKNSVGLVEHPENGTEILYPYISFYYGLFGQITLGFLITLACLVALIGVTNAIGCYFHVLTGLSYRIVVFLCTGISFVITQLGLTRIIDLSIPMLLVIYPVLIVFICLAPFYSYFNSARFVCLPPACLALLCGIWDCLLNTSYFSLVPEFYNKLPLVQQGLAWFLPCLALLGLCLLWDYYFVKPSAT